MKCALELAMIKNEAEKNYQLEQFVLDEKCREKHLEIIAKTIAYCEEVIGVALEADAVNRKKPYFKLAGMIYEDRVGNKIFSPLDRGYKSYANGAFSYNVNRDITYDVETLKNYLEKHCYKVEFINHYFKTYGCGERKGSRLEVSIDEEKLNICAVINGVKA